MPHICGCICRCTICLSQRLIGCSRSVVIGTSSALVIGNPSCRGSLRLGGRGGFDRLMPHEGAAATLSRCATDVVVLCFAAVQELVRVLPVRLHPRAPATGVTLLTNVVVFANGLFNAPGPGKYCWKQILNIWIR